MQFFWVRISSLTHEKFNDINMGSYLRKLLSDLQKTFYNRFHCLNHDEYTDLYVSRVPLSQGKHIVFPVLNILFSFLFRDVPGAESPPPER